MFRFSRFLWVVASLVALAVTLPAAIVQKDEAKSDPPGAHVEAKLVAKKATYPLDLGGKSAEEFKKAIAAAAATGDYPDPPQVDLVLAQRQRSGERAAKGPGHQQARHRAEDSDIGRREECLGADHQPGLWLQEFDGCRVLDGNGRIHSVGELQNVDSACTQGCEGRRRWLGRGHAFQRANQTYG